MADRRVLVDTSLFIEHLRAHEKSKTSLFYLVEQSEVETCSIVAAEIYYGALEAKAEELARALFNPFRVHEFTLQMAERGSSIARALKKVNRLQDLRDIMIAATAIDLNLPLATLNHVHFIHMPGLKLYSIPPPKMNQE